MKAIFSIPVYFEISFKENMDRAKLTVLVAPIIEEISRKLKESSKSYTIEASRNLGARVSELHMDLISKKELHVTQEQIRKTDTGTSK